MWEVPEQGSGTTIYRERVRLSLFFPRSDRRDFEANAFVIFIFPFTVAFNEYSGIRKTADRFMYRYYKVRVALT